MEVRMENKKEKYKSRQFLIIEQLILASFVFLSLGKISGELAFGIWSLCIASWTGREWVYKKWGNNR